MITLYTFGPAFGLPDPSPFVTKAEILLKMAGLPYRCDTGGFGKAPKGKLPYIDDAGTIVADSTLIRMHLEDRYGIDFDKGLSPPERGIAWAFEKLVEDQLYWTVVRERWLDDANFWRGPRRFFDRAPAVVRPLIIALVRRRVRGDLRSQGLGRHTAPELDRIVGRALEGIAAFLADKPWLMGPEPCGADATLHAFVTGTLCPHFETSSRRLAERHPNLVAYRDRGMQRWYPEMT